MGKAGTLVGVRAYEGRIDGAAGSIYILPGAVGWVVGIVDFEDGLAAPFPLVLPYILKGRGKGVDGRGYELGELLLDAAEAAFVHLEHHHLCAQHNGGVAGSPSYFGNHSHLRQHARSGGRIEVFHYLPIDLILAELRHYVGHAGPVRVHVVIWHGTPELPQHLVVHSPQEAGFSHEAGAHFVAEEIRLRSPVDHYIAAIDASVDIAPQLDERLLGRKPVHRHKLEVRAVARTASAYGIVVVREYVGDEMVRVIFTLAEIERLQRGISRHKRFGKVALRRVAQLLRDSGGRLHLEKLGGAGGKSQRKSQDIYA